MQCDECRQNEAIYTVSVMMGEEVSVRHLCPACMEKMNQQFHSGNLRSLLSSLLSAMGDGAAESAGMEQADKPELVCPRCGASFSRYLKTGRLGCPGCYQAFREQLQPMLMQIHGRVTHAGRVPLDTREARQHRNRQEELTRQMAMAVSQEDFETAAILRDQLRALAEGEAKE